MIETMISFRPAEYWPQRKMNSDDAQRHLQLILRHLVAGGHVTTATNPVSQADVDAVLQRFDELLREYAYHRNQEQVRNLTRELPVAVARALAQQLAKDGKLARNLTEGDIATWTDAIGRH